MVKSFVRWPRCFSLSCPGAGVVLLAALAACAVRHGSAPSTAHGMLLPGSSDLASVPFESAPINVHFVADRKSNGDSVYRDLGGAQKDYVLTAYHGTPAVMIVLSQLSSQRPFVDSALVRRDGLEPIWEIQHSGSTRTRYDYDGASVRRAVTAPDSSVAQSTATYPFRVFNFNELDELVRSVPLRAGYRAIVPLYSEGDNALETDTIQVEGTDSTGVWNVRFADKVIIGHYGIDGATRKIVRFDVNRHADKAHFRYIFGSDSARAG